MPQVGFDLGSRPEALTTPELAKILSEVQEFNVSLSELTGDADSLVDGVTRRITDIVEEAITRNTDGTISQITQTDPVTAATVAVIDVSYSNGQIAEVAVAETTSEGDTRTTTSTFTYSGDLVQNIAVSIGTA